MKKTLLVVLIVLLSISLFACGETPVKESTPVISVNPTTIEINVGGEVDLLSGVSATDEVDGTVSVTIDDRGGFDNTKAGTYTIKYKAVNSQGKEATATRTIKVNKVEVVPVITVNPAEVEIYAGEDVDLLFGVSATSDGETISVIIEDDNDFDNSKEGTYTIKYKAVNSDGKEATATRTIIVNKPLSELALEVRKNYLGENKWAGNIITFKHELFVELDADAEISRQSGVFYNTTDASITLSVEGSYGCSAVLTANGVVVEGRDGANSKLVNAQNPTRTSSTTTKFDEDTTVSSAFAKNLVIPAKGYAVVIQSNYAGTTADSDGRSFMNYNVIYAIDNVVRLFWVDDETIITPYENQGPAVSGNTTVYVALNSQDNINNLVAAGLVVTDDNGTFALEDDVTISEVTVKDNGGYDSTKEAEYTFTLTVTDGAVSKDFTRVVSVLGADKCTTIKVGDNSHIVLNSSVSIDKDLTSVGSNTYIVYTPNYQLPEGEETLGYTNGFGEAFLLNEYGEIVVIYDGANGRKFTEEHHTLSPTVDTESCTPDSYLTDAFKEAQEKGLYLLVAPNSTANNADGGSRKFLLSNRSWGAKVSITGVSFKVREVTFAIGEKSFVANEDLVKINEVVALGDVAKQKMLIFTSACEADAINCNGYGVAIVLNRYGKLVRIYDGANGKLFDKDNPSGKTGAGFGGGDYGTVAYTQLQEGETLIIFPNDGVNGADSPRTFGLGLRMDGSIGKVASITGFEFEEATVTFAIGEKSFTADADLVKINEVVALGDVANQKMLIFTSACEADAINCNGYGVAIVLNKFGKLVRVYDGANGKLFDKDNPSGKTGAGFGGGDYGTVAYTQLQEGETLIIFPNDGANGADSPRTFGLGLRMDGSIGKVATITGFEFEEDAVLFEINNKSFKAGEGLYAINEVLTAADVAKKRMVIFTSACEADAINCNGYGVAIVLDQYGTLVRIYDGANGKLFDAENPSGKTGAGFGGGDYATYAYTQLQEGETLIIFPNDGVNGADSPRTFGLGLRMDGSIGKKAALTGFKFKEEAGLKINGKAFTKEGEITYAYNDATATNASHDFLIFTSAFSGTSALTNGYGVAMVIKDNKIERIYDGASGKYFDADNTSGVVDSTKCTSNVYFQMALASLGSGEWLLVAPHDGGSNVARGFLYGNRTVGATVECTLCEIETSTRSMNALAIGNKVFYGAEVLINGYGKAADLDVAIYTYGYTGRVIKNGWSEGFVISLATGKVVRIYDGFNGKYFDADNTSGVAAGDYYANGTLSLDAFESLNPNEILVIGLNGGRNSNAARAFLVGNRTIGAAALALNVNIPAAATSEIDIYVVEVDGDRYYTAAEMPVNEAVTAANVPFICYQYGYTGTPVANGYGVAIIVKEGKIVRIYDGANGKYYDADNTTGIQDNSKCAAGTYLAQAFASLQEGEILICAPNGGTTGNVARGFLLDHRAIGKAASAYKLI